MKQSMKYLIAPNRVLDILSKEVNLPKVCIQILLALYYENGPMTYAGLAHKLGREWKAGDKSNIVFKAVALLRKRNLLPRRKEIKINGNGIEVISEMQMKFTNIQKTEGIL